MIDQEKTKILEFVRTAQYDEAFRYLREEVLLQSADNELYNDCIVIESRYAEARRAGNLNLIDFSELNRGFSNVAEAITWLVRRITVANVSENLRRRTAEHRRVDYAHKYTCDRRDQTDLFEFLTLDTTEKVRFFYLYGDARQEHESLFKRLGLDKRGQLSNWKGGQREPVRQLKSVDFKPRFSENVTVFQMYVLRELFAHFFEPLNATPQLLTKKLADLLASPQLEGFGPDDYVFILLTIDDHEWRGENTVDVVRNLYRSFCKTSELPAAAPNFYFFFGVEYRKDNEQVKAQVRNAMDSAAEGDRLPELGPVRREDVERWFNEYDGMRAPGKEPHEMAELLFPGRTELDMADVELKLEEIIDMYNKRMVIHIQ